MTAQEHQKAENSLLDDGPMSDLIKNARPLPTSSQDAESLESQAAKMANQLPIFDRKDASDVDFDDPYADMIFPIETKKTKRLEKRARLGPPDIALPDGEGATGAHKRPLDSHDTSKAPGDTGAAFETASDEHVTAEPGNSAPPPKKKKKRVGFVDDAAGEGSSTLQSSESQTLATPLPTRSMRFEDDPTDIPMPTSIFGMTG